MLKKQIVDFIVSIFLIIAGSLFLIVPFFKNLDARFIFVGVISLYGLLNLISYILTIPEKQYYGISIMISSIIVLVLLGFLEKYPSHMNIPLAMFVWISIVSLIKLSKCKHFNDQNKSIWIFIVVALVLFILIGMLTIINLYLETEMQVIILGYFYFIHGILELVEPISSYLLKDGN